MNISTAWRPTLVLVLAFVLANPALACSTFFISRDGYAIFGRNYDWMVEDGYLMVNKRGIRKASLVMDEPMTWVSRHGSVTFNQYGRDFPIGGMNEAGLVIENMWLDETRYPRSDDRGAVNCLQWIQFQLDTASSVEEVIASDRKVRISQLDVASLHFLVADKRGKCAAIEFLNGTMAVHRKFDASSMALTNDTYQSSVHYLRGHLGFGGTVPVPRTSSSLDRFVRSLAGAQSCRAGDAGGAVDHAFTVLHDVAQGDFTKWSIVYDLSQARIHFRTLTADQRRHVETKQFDYAGSTPVLMLNLNVNRRGDVTGQFVPYDPALNRALVRTSCAKTPLLSGVPVTLLEMVASYPGTTRRQVADGTNKNESTEQPSGAEAEPVTIP